MDKNTKEDKTKITKTRDTSYDLAQDIMPKGERVEATRMHKSRFEK